MSNHEELIEEAESWVAHTKPSVVGAILRDMVSALVSVRAERDAALAAIADARGALELLSNYADESNDAAYGTLSAQFVKAHVVTALAALDGAPEPETAPENYEPKCNCEHVKRHTPPPLPVEGESK